MTAFVTLSFGPGRPLHIHLHLHSLDYFRIIVDTSCKFEHTHTPPTQMPAVQNSKQPNLNQTWYMSDYISLSLSQHTVWFTAKETHEGLAPLNYGFYTVLPSNNMALLPWFFQSSHKGISVISPLPRKRLYGFMNQSWGSIKWSKMPGRKITSFPSKKWWLRSFSVPLTSEPLNWFTFILHFKLRQNDCTSQQVQLLRADHPSGAAHLRRLRQCVAHRFPGAQAASAGSRKRHRKKTWKNCDNLSLKWIHADRYDLNIGGIYIQYHTSMHIQQQWNNHTMLSLQMNIDKYQLFGGEQKGNSVLTQNQMVGITMNNRGL